MGGSKASKVIPERDKTAAAAAAGAVSCPEAFVPHRAFRGGHAQTLAGAFLPRRHVLPPAEDRLFRVAPDAQVLCRCHWQAQRAAALTVVIVHGLEGSSESQYVLGTAAKAWAAGMNVVRMNVRNCGGTERLCSTLYHSGLSSDVDAVARELIESDRLPRLALAGFSMGGNQVLKLAGEWGGAVPPQVRAVAAVSPAMDLGASSDALHHWRNRVYELYFMLSLCRRMRRKARLFPGQYSSKALPWFGSLRRFDDEVTARYCGFQGAEDYYQRAAASRVADGIAIPTLILNALDDPFIRLLPETRARLKANPQVWLVETAGGGHCGFLAAPDGYDGRWAERQVVEFFRRF